MKKIFATIAAATILAAPTYAETVSATLDLGDFENATEVIEGSNIEQAPFNFFYEYSGSQVIYSTDEIADLFTHGAKIQSITFKYGDPSMSTYYDFSESVNCYLQLIDDPAFTVIDRKTNWFTPVSTSTTATASFDFDYTMSEGFEIVLTFPEPFEVTAADAGKNLLVTCSSTCTNGDPSSGQYVNAFRYANEAQNYRMACYGRDNTTDFTTQVNTGGQISYAEGTHSDVYKTDLPVARIAYTYDDNISGIESITDAAAGVTDVYDLQGRRVAAADDLTPGIYIVRQGEKTRKVIVK